MSLAGLGFSAFGAYQQSRAAREQANYSAAVAANNARVSEWQAQDAIRRGDEEANRIAREARQLKGAQRVSLAAKGLDLNAGTAGELQDQTDFFSLADQGTARNNARREAWATRAQGSNFSAQAQAERNKAGSISPGFAAATSLIGGAGAVADKWYTGGTTQPSGTEWRKGQPMVN